MNMMIMLIPILVAVALLTLMERKIMGISHFRTGPKKVGMKGLTQPFSDALKLFTKENMKMMKTNYTAFILAPMMIISIYSINWINLPMSSAKNSNKMMIMMMLSMLSMSVFFFMMSGWSSNSKYSLMGSFRSTAQTVSYEIVLILMLLPMIMVMSSMDMDMNSCKWGLSMMMMMFMVPMWMTTMLAETNRTPFDLTESESELVSGFNTEFSSGAFSVIFVAEYMSIMFMMTLTSLMLMETTVETSLMTMMMLSWMIWSRITLPRMRYDKLMMMAWKMMTPTTIMGMMMMMMMNT